MRVLSLCLLLALPIPAFGQTGNRPIVRVGPGSQIQATVSEVAGQAGLRVVNVTSGGPADAAGLKAEDVIVTFAGETVRSLNQFTRLMRETPAGRPVTMAIERGGKRMELTVTPRAAVTVETGSDEGFREGPLTAPVPSPWTSQPPPQFQLEPRADLQRQLQELQQQFQQRLGASQVGIQMKDVTAADVKRLGLPSQEGVLVTGVTGGSPAERADIAANDVVLEFDGMRVRGAAQLERLIQETPVGRAIPVVIFRNGQRSNRLITPRDWPGITGPGFLAPTLPPRPYNRNQPPLWNFNPRVVPSPPALRDRVGQLGIGAADLTPQLAEYFGTKEGVLVQSVTGDSPASRAGVKAGDIITSIDGKAVRERIDVREALVGKRAGDTVKLGVVRDRKPLTLTVTVGGR